MGAPRGSYPGGVASGLPGNSQGALPNTGLVYVCPVEPGSCGPLTGNGQGADLRLFDGEGNAERPVPVTTGNMTTNDTEQDEEKSGQLMGGTLFSNGDNFMVSHTHTPCGNSGCDTVCWCCRRVLLSG